MMSQEEATRLQGFAWLARRRTASDRRSPGGGPFDGLDSPYRPPCWPVGRAGLGDRHAASWEAFLILTPTIAFGPPQVGPGWVVEPAGLDELPRDGRIRLADMALHTTLWGLLPECEFEVRGATVGQENRSECAPGR
ncbi:MAG TPA: hypothetical protein VFF52_10290 [Isosphaeraceae bacterium]|nr:hypothetical protein [Isosphaeraceae bacterium]